MNVEENFPLMEEELSELGHDFYSEACVLASMLMQPPINAEIVDDVLIKIRDKLEIVQKHLDKYASMQEKIISDFEWLENE